MDPQLSDKQQTELNDALSRGAAFEALIKHPGWQLLQAQFQNRMAAFLNGLLLNSKVGIESFEAERQQLIGMKSFLNSIELDLKTLADYRKKDAKRSTE